MKLCPASAPALRRRDRTRFIKSPINAASLKNIGEISALGFSVEISTVEVFAQAAGPISGRLFFLSTITDPQGNTVVLNYDSTFAANGKARLASVSDAVPAPNGGMLTFGYDTANPLLIVRSPAATTATPPNCSTTPPDNFSASPIPSASPPPSPTRRKISSGR